MSGVTATATPTETRHPGDADAAAGPAPRPRAARARRPRPRPRAWGSGAGPRTPRRRTGPGRRPRGRPRRSPGDLAQHVVAHGVPERVVELLEAVDVDHQHAHLVLRPAAPGEQPEVLVEVAAVGQPRERVGGGAGLGLAQRVDARERRRRLDAAASRIRCALTGHAVARAPREDDRALDPAVDAQRRGEHVGQPVGVATRGSAIRSAIRWSAPSRAGDACDGRRRGSGAGPNTPTPTPIGFCEARSPSLPRPPVRTRRSAAIPSGTSSGSPAGSGSIGTAVRRRPRDAVDREARRRRRPPPGRRARPAAARCATWVRRAAWTTAAPRGRGDSGRRRTTATWSAPVPTPSSSTIASTIASGETERASAAQDPGERLGLGAARALGVGDGLALADGQQPDQDDQHEDHEVRGSGVEDHPQQLDRCRGRRRGGRRVAGSGPADPVRSPRSPEARFRRLTGS